MQVAITKPSVHRELEREIASVHKKQESMVFNSCYTANEASIAALVRAHPGCVIISDSDNHASMIQGDENVHTNFPHLYDLARYQTVTSS